jgi:hypothetical protein
VNGTEKARMAAEVMQKFGFSPAGAEWLQALHEAQKKATPIQRTKGIPDRNGGVKFFVAPAENFTDESRRCLHPHGMGWFRQATKLTEVNPHTQSLKLTGCYVVYHAPSGQAQVCFAEWSARADGDAMAGAHTRMTRRFIQGLLQISVVDEGAVPEDPPTIRQDMQGYAQVNPCTHPQGENNQGHAFHGDPVHDVTRGTWSSEVVCTTCGQSLGWAPCAAPVPPQQQMFAQQQAAPPPPQHQAPAPAPAPAPQHQAPAPAPAPQQAAPPQHQAPAPAPQHQAPAPAPAPAAQPQPTGPLPPISHSVVVQQAQAELGATQITEEEMKREMASPPENPPAPANPGEPNSPDEWRAALAKQGMDDETAMHVAMLDDASVVEPPLVDDMRNWAWSYYQGDVAKITEVWNSVGFEPIPGLPLADRPRPTGIQSKRFLAQMQFKSKAATPAAQ